MLSKLADDVLKPLIEENKDIIKRIARTPATRNLFENHNNAKRLSKTEQMKYQETLAKIVEIYLFIKY